MSFLPPVLQNGGPDEPHGLEQRKELCFPCTSVESMRCTIHRLDYSQFGCWRDIT